MKAACVLLIAAGVALMVLPAEAASPPNREVARLKHEVARLKAKVTHLERQVKASNQAIAASTRR